MANPHSMLQIIPDMMVGFQTPWRPVRSAKKVKVMKAVGLKGGDEWLKGGFLETSLVQNTALWRCCIMEHVSVAYWGMIRYWYWISCELKERGRISGGFGLSPHIWHVFLAWSTNTKKWVVRQCNHVTCFFHSFQSTWIILGSSSARPVFF